MTTPTNLVRHLPQTFRDSDDGHLYLTDSNEGNKVYHPVNRVQETKSANFTLTDLDHGKLFVVDTAGVDCTVPAGLRDDFRAEFIFTAASGDLTFVVSSTTINPSGTLNVSTRYGRAVLDHLGSDVYNLSGTIA